MNERIKWLRIARTKNVGAITFAKLLDKFSNPDDAINSLMARGFAVPTEEFVQEELEKLHNIGGELLFCKDALYPKLLKTCPDMPPFLSCIGDMNLLKGEMISIVGSRNASIYGNKMAQQLATELVSHGLIVVSGMASGIDTSAHKGAGTSTIAVLGGGVDVVYPQSNADLYQRLKSEGLIISEAPLGSPVAPTLFHARNRIIAGISVGTVIVEGAENSGSMITVRYAQDYNRDVFAVPGSPFEPRAYAPNRVIQDGAYLITSANDIISNIKPAEKRYKFEFNITTPPPVIMEGLTDTILSCLTTVPLCIDKLHVQVGGPIATLRACLMDLELDGKIVFSIGDTVSLNYK